MDKIAVAREKLAREPVPPPTPKRESNGLPEVLLPFPGRNERTFAEDIAENLPPQKLFLKGKEEAIVEVAGDLTLGNEGEESQLLVPFGIVTSKFKEMVPKRFVTWIEQFINIGVEVKDDKEVVFLSKTMSNEHAEHILAGDAFPPKLSRILRILDVPIPMRTIRGDIVYPVPGYNPRLSLYCDKHVPHIQEIDYNQALDIIVGEVYGEFNFHNDQSRTHAIARLITPYIRGVIGFNKRIPLWLFEANRPGAGKDYCNGCTQLVYQERAFEDAPLGSKEETWKRITSATLAGRRMMYFANCVNELDDPYLATAVTDTVFRARTLGTNSAKSDLDLEMEIDFALSANGLTYKEDFERRMRRVTLSFFEQDANSRRFNRPDLWGWILENRVLILCAIHTLFLKWVRQGCPKGQTPFTSFSAWGETAGGIMMVNNLGDSCLAQVSQFSRNPQEVALIALWEIAFATTSGDAEAVFTKPQLYTLITHSQKGLVGLGGDDRLDYFGSLEDG